MSAMPAEPCLPFDPFTYQRRSCATVSVPGVRGTPVAIGGTELIQVGILPRKLDDISHKLEQMGDFTPDFVYQDIVELDPRDTAAVAAVNAETMPRLVAVKDGLDLAVIPAYRLLAQVLTSPHPIVLKDTLYPSSDDQAGFVGSMLNSSAVLGSLICDGIGDAILVQGESAPGQSLRLAFNILQASGARIFKTDYVACPSCGRTLFNLQETTARIKEATQHLKGVKIAVMGCIVNGPGEMADADFGYVGGAPNKINLYVGKQPVKFNIPESEAVARLVDLIKEHKKWVEPPVATA